MSAGAAAVSAGAAAVSAGAVTVSAATQSGILIRLVVHAIETEAEDLQKVFAKTFQVGSSARFSEVTSGQRRLTSS